MSDSGTPSDARRDPSEEGRTPRLDASFFFGQGWPYLLVPFIPAAIALDIANASDAVVFIVSALGIIPTAALMGRATEELANRSGPGIGGLLNVTFGNAPELIIARFAFDNTIEVLSGLLAGILIVVYVAGLVFSLRTHRDIFNPEYVQEDTWNWSVRTSVLMLAIAGVAVAVMSEILIGSLAAASESLGLSEFFIGVIVVAIVGNAAEHWVAVAVAIK